MWQLTPLEPYPATFANFLDQNIEALQDQTRTLNSLFAFSAIGYKRRQLKYGGLQNVVITGRVYHMMLDLDADQGSLRWFLFDERGYFKAGEARRLQGPPRGPQPLYQDLTLHCPDNWALALRSLPKSGCCREGGGRDYQSL